MEKTYNIPPGGVEIEEGGVAYLKMPDETKIRKSDVEVRADPDIKDVIAGFKRKMIDRVSKEKHIMFLKEDLFNRIKGEDGKKLIDLFNQSNFQKIADYYNKPLGVNIINMDISVHEIAKCIDLSEFLQLTDGEQRAWEVFKMQFPFGWKDEVILISGIDIVFGKLEKTHKAIMEKITRASTNFESLTGTKGYVVTAFDIIETLR